MIVLKIYYHLMCIIKKIFYKLIFGSKVKFSKGVNFRKNFSINIETKSARIIIGKNTFFNNNCTISCFERVEIGQNTLFGENVKIYDNNHSFNIAGKTIKEQGYSMGPIKIGNNCWIANNVLILKGVTIGDNVVISAGLVIRENIESNSIVKQNSNNITIEKILYKEN